MNSKPATEQWIVTTDLRRAALFSCSRISGNRLHVDERKVLENDRHLEPEHHRPSTLGGQGRGPEQSAAPHFAGEGHRVEEEHRRFAREVRRWLGEVSKEFSAAHLELFAPARFLGVLREEIAREPGTSVSLHDCELATLRPSQLADHPAVLHALGAR